MAVGRREGFLRTSFGDAMNAGSSKRILAGQDLADR